MTSNAPLDRPGDALPTDAPAALHPVLAAIVQELERERTQLLRAAERVPEALRHARPAADRWTAAEILAHVAKVEESSGKLFSVFARRQREAGAAEDTESRPDEVLAAFARHPLRLRGAAPEMVAPEPDAEFAKSIEQLAQSRQRLLEAIRKANGLPLASVSAPHPRLGDLTMYEWLLMIAHHEARHTDQLNELHEQLLYPDTTPLPNTDDA
jgi:hypothetical protein